METPIENERSHSERSEESRRRRRERVCSLKDYFVLAAGLAAGACGSV